MKERLEREERDEQERLEREEQERIERDERKLVGDLRQKSGRDGNMKSARSEHAKKSNSAVDTRRCSNANAMSDNAKTENVEKSVNVMHSVLDKVYIPEAVDITRSIGHLV